MYEVRLLGSRFPLIRDIGTTWTQSGWIHPNRVTDYNVFIYCFQGQMQVMENGTEYLLREGDILFLKKGVHHWGGEGTLPDTSTLWIHFYETADVTDTEELEQVALQKFHMIPTYQIFSPKQYDMKIVLPKTINVKNVPFIAKKLKELYELYNSSRTFRHIHLSMETMSVFLELYGLSQKSQLPSKSDVLVQKLVKYLENHCDEMLDTDKIKEEFQLNYHYLSTVFKSKLGTSIFRYHERQRIQKAAELLKNTSMNITEVSYTVHFKSPYYFSRVFKKVMGESPSDYIKNIYRMI